MTEEKFTTKEMQSIVTAYFLVEDAASGLDRCEDYGANLTLARIRGRIEGLESEMLLEMRSYARLYEPSRWAMTVIPDAFAAGYACGIHMNSGRIESPSRLYGFCGMEAKRYLPPAEVKRIIVEILGGRTMGLVTNSEVSRIAERIQRNPDALPKTPTFDQVFLWATKKHHSEFLRILSIRLGHWIAEHDDNPYRKVYIERLASANASGRVPSMEQVEQRSRNAAVRAFLIDYFHHIPVEDVRKVG